MSDDLIYWSYCSPVRVRHRQPEPKPQPKPKPKRSAPKVEVMTQSGFQEAMLRQMQNQRTGQQQYLGLGGLGNSIRGLFG